MRFVLVLAVGLTACTSSVVPDGDAAVSGVVIAIDLSDMVVDGPGILELRTDTGSQTVHVPSGESFCDVLNWGDLRDLEVGDTVRAQGALGADGVIRPCYTEEGHYLRLG